MTRPPRACVCCGWLNSVRAPFGVGRLSASKLLVALVKRDAKNMLAKIPKEVWSVLTAWMLEYRHNNLFHILYMELWHELVMANHDSIEVRGLASMLCRA